MNVRNNIAAAVAILVLLPLTSSPAAAHASSLMTVQSVPKSNTHSVSPIRVSDVKLAKKPGIPHAVVLPMAQSITKTTANLNLRQKAATSSKSLGIMKKGSTVKLTGRKSGKWVQLRFGTKTGWASSDYLKTAKAPAPKIQYRYAQRNGNIYKSASKNDKKAIGTLTKGTRVEWRTWDSGNRRDEVKVNGKWVWTDITAPNKPAATPVPKIQYRYAQRNGNIYKSASKNDKKAIGTLTKGTRVEWRTWDSGNRRDEVKVNGKWVWTDITAPNNPAATKPAETKPKPAPKPANQDKDVADYGRFVTANLNLRQGPGTQHKSLTRVPLGNKVTVTHHASVNGWVKVRHGSQSGYLSGAYLNKAGQHSVAVYGTLRTGQSAYSVMGKFQQKTVNQRIAESSLYQLWNRNWTFLTSGPKTVVAEQFQYGASNGASMMKRLDIYEGQLKYKGKNMYSRQRVTMADGSVSWAYKTTPTGEKVAKSSGNLVSSGDFLKRS
ncbi:hypothetical protein CQ018_02470 [Arthrobacter sp. MYb227]|nr:hypothetical protein CQ018_02470 [Arthrobacter sp. MYb227]